MRATLILLGVLAVASPAAAQTSVEPAIAIRGFLMASEQQFAATETFDAVFGQSNKPFWGGGAEVVFRHGIFVDVTVSRFEQTGQRAFRANGKNYQLGIPLTATLTPVEFTAGYRFRLPKTPRVVPYLAAGGGSYAYRETSQFSDASENLDTRHSGFVAYGGFDVRLHRWVGVAADVEYTHIPGILGTGGVSQDIDHPNNTEHDLGGVAARIRVVVGR